MDTTARIVIDYLRRNPASATCLLNDPFAHVSLILEICEREPEKLSVFCDANIFEGIVQATKSDIAQEMMMGTLLYGRYASLIAKDVDKSSERHRKAVENVFKESFSVCARAWKSILYYWKYIGDAEKEDWRKATEPVVRSLVLLASEKGGEILYLDNLACLSMPFPLALHCWLFAPDSDIRNQLDDVRETAEGYDGIGVGFFDFHYKSYLATVGSDQMLEKSLHIMKCVQDCIGSRRRAMELVLTLNRDSPVQLPSGCEAELMDIVWQTLQTGSDSSKCFINDSANAFLDIILDQSENPIEILRKIFCLHDGARVFTCNAETQAQPLLTGASKIFLFSQMIKYIETNSNEHPEEAVAGLKSVFFQQLSPVMRPLLLCLRDLDTSSGGNYGAELVVNQLLSLGRIIGLCELVE